MIVVEEISDYTLEEIEEIQVGITGFSLWFMVERILLSVQSLIRMDHTYHMNF
jgi:hypothetical protein